MATIQDVINADIVNLFLNSELLPGVEPVIYKPLGGSPKTINAQVYRNYNVNPLYGQDGIQQESAVVITFSTDPTLGIVSPKLDDLFTVDSLDWTVIDSPGADNLGMQTVTGKRMEAVEKSGHNYRIPR